MQTSATARGARRWDSGRLGAVALTILLVLPAAGAARSGAGSATSRIAARSYEPDHLNGIVGRSARPLPPAPETLVRTDPRRLRLRPYDRLIERHSQANDLDPDLVRAVIFAESGGNRQAVSGQGAAGLMQLMPGTARDLGVADPFDAEQNIASGARYLRRLLDRFGSVELALWAYNAGPQAVSAGRMPTETREYVPRVLALRRAFRQVAGR